METNYRGEYIKRLANKYISYALLIALLVFLLPRNFEFVKLEINRFKWHIHHVDHYRFELRAICHCWTQPMTIEVRNGKIVSGGNKTIEDLFDQIQKEDFEDDVINVTYDGKYGFPLVMMFDRVRNGDDDELMYVISNFEVLP